MSTTKTPHEFDYETYAKTHTPDPSKLERGPAARERRRKDIQAKKRITIRIDEDILEGFKEQAGQGKPYQTLMNQALREWLRARQGESELGRLLKTELEAQSESQPLRSKSVLELLEARSSPAVSVNELAHLMVLMLGRFEELNERLQFSRKTLP